MPQVAPVHKCQRIGDHAGCDYGLRCQNRERCGVVSLYLELDKVHVQIVRFGKRRNALAQIFHAKIRTRG